MRRFISIAADLSVVALMCILGWRIVDAALLSRDREPRAGMSCGTNIMWQGSSGGVALLLSERCPYCDSSVDAFRRILNAVPGMHKVALFAGSELSGRQYLEKQALNISEVHGSVRIPWKIVKTPTVLLCDSGGKIIRAWEGQVSEKTETEFHRVAQERIR